MPSKELLREEREKLLSSQLPLQSKSPLEEVPYPLLVCFRPEVLHDREAERVEGDSFHSHSFYFFRTIRTITASVMGTDGKVEVGVGYRKVFDSLFPALRAESLWFSILSTSQDPLEMSFQLVFSFRLLFLSYFGKKIE